MEDKIRIAELKWRLGRGRQGIEPAWVQSKRKNEEQWQPLRARRCIIATATQQEASWVLARPCVTSPAGVSVTGFKAAFVAAAGAGVLAEVPARFCSASSSRRFFSVSASASLM